MKFQILAATLAACAAAAPALEYRQTDSNVTIVDNEPFAVTSIRSGSDIQYASISAAENSLLLKLPAQNATCSPSAHTLGYAKFYISNGALYLLTPSNVTQELYTDRSGMGQGVLQYSTTPGGYQRGANSEVTGWVADPETGVLTFNGAGLLACPGSIDGSWSVWVDAGISNPAGNKDCVGFVAQTVPVTGNNVTCTYGYTEATA